MLLRRTASFLRASIAFAVLSSVVLMCIPFCDAFGEDMERLLSMLIAGVFWGDLILEQIFFWIANARRKKIETRAFHGRRLVKASTGMWTFGSSKEARVCDLILCGSFASTIILAIMNVQEDWIIITSVTLLVMSFNLHCILNGKTYRYIKAFRKIKKGAEKT